MSSIESESTQRLLDRLDCLELAIKYALAVDRRDFEGLQRLFCDEATLSVVVGGELVTEARGIHAVMVELRRATDWRASTHFVGNQMVVVIGHRAEAVTYCFAHIFPSGEDQGLMQVTAIRYEDVCVRRDGRWLFQSRRLSVDWIETRRTLATNR